MELVPGTDLAQLLVGHGALPIEVACRYGAQLGEALRHIAVLGLVHRDVKPGNVLVTEDGAVAKLSDLGLARFDGADAESTDLTRIGMMIGTPDYAAPEQIRDSRAADIRSDLYSLGCTLYQMLAGRPPFAGLDKTAKLHHHPTADPVPVEHLRPDVPAPVTAVVRRLMAKKPRDRYQDPAEVLVDLPPYLHRSGETISDVAAVTALGLPACAEPALPPTEEIPPGQLILDTGPGGPPAPRERWGRRLGRFHWLIAVLIAGAAMGLVMRRG